MDLLDTMMMITIMASMEDIKTPTCLRVIRHKVTVTNVISNDRWCKIKLKINNS